MSKKNKKILKLKEILKEKDKYKGYFRSRGYSEVKITRLDENGNQYEEIVAIEIYPLGDHPILKDFREKYPQPKPPVKRDLVDLTTGESVVKLGLKPAQVKNNPKYGFADIYDFTDENYQKELEEWNNKLIMLQLMIVFDVVDEFGIDKIDEFEKYLLELGFTANQLNKIAEDIKNLDFLPTE
ncbi:MAG: hypothetical protein ACP6IS_12420 [Candidatus Asgardarchaeia archaeon]